MIASQLITNPVYKWYPGNICYKTQSYDTDPPTETRSKTLVRRGSMIAQNSVSWGLEIAIPIGILGLLLMDLRRRKIINDNQLALTIKTPTYLAVAGTCLGISVYVVGRVFERF